MPVPFGSTVSRLARRPVGERLCCYRRYCTLPLEASTGRVSSSTRESKITASQYSTVDSKGNLYEGNVIIPGAAPTPPASESHTQRGKNVLRVHYSVCETIVWNHLHRLPGSDRHRWAHGTSAHIFSCIFEACHTKISTDKKFTVFLTR